MRMALGAMSWHPGFGVTDQILIGMPPAETTRISLHPLVLLAYTDRQTTKSVRPVIWLLINFAGGSANALIKE